jgi:hypothetical protein
VPPPEWVPLYVAPGMWFASAGAAASQASAATTTAIETRPSRIVLFDTIAR